MKNEPTVQITVRLRAEQAALLDELVGRGRYPSRAAVVRRRRLGEVRWAHGRGVRRAAGGPGVLSREGPSC